MLYKCFQSVFLILVSLPPLNAIHCHANVHETEHHEDCGPDGYCFFLDMSSSKRGIVYYRGCDNILMCEVSIIYLSICITEQTLSRVCIINISCIMSRIWIDAVKIEKLVKLLK